MRFLIQLFLAVLFSSAAANAQAALPGEIYLFGRYYQAARENAPLEPIEWQVLEVEEDGTVFMAASHAIDGRRFNDSSYKGGWEKSSLRAWLNGEFLAMAFSDEEKKAIKESNLDHSRLWLLFETEQNLTSDRIFLLSLKEAKKYFKTEQRKLPATEYASMHLCRNLFGPGGSWWLRTSGLMPGRVCSIDINGMPFLPGALANSDGGCVRPALRIKPDGIKLLRRKAD